MNTFLQALSLINWKMVAIIVLLYSPTSAIFAFDLAKSNEPSAVKHLNRVLSFGLGVFIFLQMRNEDVFSKINNAHAAAFSIIIVVLCVATFILLQFLSSLTWNYHAEKINRKLADEEE